MFWGLIMEPQKRYTQNIENAFRVTMASLDISNTDGQPSQLMCNYEGRNYLLCTLQKPGVLQCALDLYFEEGTTVSFATNGKSHIHLTGYLTKDIEDEFEEDSEEEQENQELEVQPKKKTRANDNKIDQPLKKKAKLEEVEEEESDDSDFDMEKMMNDEEQSDEEEEVSGEEEDVEEEEEDDSEDEEGNPEEDDESSGIEDSDKEEVEIKMNGLSKKNKKAKSEKVTIQKVEKPTPQKGKKELVPKIQTPGPKSKKQEQAVDNAKKGKIEKQAKGNQTQNSKRKTLPGGVIIEDLKEGQGDPASNGSFVQVYYQGQLQSSGKVFDKAMNGPGFGFRLGTGEVIKGWDVGVKGMKVGGKRRITCPPHLAYGTKGSPPVIPPNSTLVFDVEVKKIK